MTPISPLDSFTTEIIAQSSRFTRYQRIRRRPVRAVLARFSCRGLSSPSQHFAPIMGKGAAEMPTDRPTKEEIADARATLLQPWGAIGYEDDACLEKEEIEAVRTLLAATAPPPDEPRPDDMAALTRLVAMELRKRGIWATTPHDQSVTICVPCWRFKESAGGNALRWQRHALHTAQFDNLTPRECADVIQAEEARKAQDWAGDR